MSPINSSLGQSFGVSTTFPKIVTQNLLLHLDAGQRISYNGGTTWRDLSGNSNNGTLTNGPTFVDSNGGYISFDGVNDIVDFGNILNFTSQNFSFSMFLYYGAVSSNGSAICGNSIFQTNGYSIYISNTSNIGIITNQSGAFQISSSSAITTGNWYGISIVKNGSSCKIFINGVDSTISSGTHINPASATTSFTINSTVTPANIRISNFQVYNKALTNNEIIQNFNSIRSRFLI